MGAASLMLILRNISSALIQQQRIQSSSHFPPILLDRFLLPSNEDDELTVFHSDWVKKYAGIPLKSLPEKCQSLAEFIMKAPLPSTKSTFPLTTASNGAKSKPVPKMHWDISGGICQKLSD